MKCCQDGEERAAQYVIAASRMQMHWTATLAAILSVAMLVFIFMGGTRAWAQDGQHNQGHAENHDW
jgi:uncharacterized integral membrane protein